MCIYRVCVLVYTTSAIVYIDIYDICYRHYLELWAHLITL